MRIKELRIANEYTQLELAEKVGCNQTAIGKYERGDLEPNIETLSKLCQIFNCSIDYLVGREDDFGIIENKKNELTDRELKMLSIFKQLIPEMQDNVIAMISPLVENENKKRKNI